MPRTAFLSGLMAALLVGCQPTDNKASTSAAAEQARIAAVTGGLRAPVQAKGRPVTTWSLAERMAHYKVPGLSIAVLDSGRVVWARGFGVKEAGGADSVTPETLFQAASISKPVAATGTLRLVEQGKLSLDENVNAKLTSWQVPENRFTRTEKVTLRRILSHSAGLTIHGFPGYAATDTVPSVVEVLDGRKPANTAPVRVDTVPGARWSYSGGGVTIEQLLVSDVTGEPFPALMQRLVLGPAGMTRSTYEQPLPEARAAEAARGHLVAGTMVAGRWHTYPEMAAAGLWTTPTDLAKWSLAIAAARAGRDTTLLSQAMATRMLTVEKGQFGLGPALNGSGQGFNFGHGGSNEGFRSQVIYFPETGQGAAVMTNGDAGSELIGELLYAVAAEYRWPDYGPKEIVVVTVDSVALARLTGEYVVTVEKQQVPLTVAIEGGELLAKSPLSAEPEVLLAESSNTFVGTSNGTRFEFDLAATGKARGVKIDRDGFVLLAKRK
jgi:CubicO group peptidase (beta-lactamase class C family)